MLLQSSPFHSLARPLNSAPSQFFSFLLQSQSSLFYSEASPFAANRLQSLAVHIATKPLPIWSDRFTSVLCSSGSIPFISLPQQHRAYLFCSFALLCVATLHLNPSWLCNASAVPCLSSPFCSISARVLSGLFLSRSFPFRGRAGPFLSLSSLFCFVPQQFGSVPFLSTSSRFNSVLFSSSAVPVLSSPLLLASTLFSSVLFYSSALLFNAVPLRCISFLYCTVPYPLSSMPMRLPSPLLHSEASHSSSILLQHISSLY